MVTDAMIVAGGKGTRLRPLTLDTPKPLLEFCGAPFLEGVMHRVADAGVTRLWLVVGQDTEVFETALAAPAAELGLELRCVPEPEPLDTAGGVRSVADQVAGAFLVLNGDVLTDVDLRAVVDAHERAGAEATLVLTRVEDTSTFGVCVREGTRITSFVEKPPPGTLPGQDAINAGTYVLEPSVFDGHAPGRLSFERQVFPALLERGGHVEGVVWDGVWADLGTPERYRDGTRSALDGALSWPSVTDVPDRGDGVRVAADAVVAPDARLDGPVLVCAGATIGAGAQVGPHTVVGAGATVDAGATVTGSVLFAGATVGAEVAVDGLLAGVGSQVSAGATVGRDAVIGDRIVIGADDVVADEGRVPAPE